MTPAISRTTLHALLSAALALVATLTTFSATTARAATAPESYVATLTTPLVAPREAILEGVMWRCAGEKCRGARNGERPRLTCRRVARKFGPIAKFSSATTDLAPEDLAHCNRAR